MPKHVLATLMDQIYNAFEPFTTQEGKKPQFAKSRIHAADILPQLEASRLTIIKARKMLGVAAVVIAGRHNWLCPTVYVQDALRKLPQLKGRDEEKGKAKRRERDERDGEAIGRYFAGVLADERYRMKYDDLIARLKEELGRSYSWGVRSRAIAHSGIIREDEYCLLPHPSIETWLDTQLCTDSGKPVREDTLVKNAPCHADVLMLFIYGHKARDQNGVAYQHRYSYRRHTIKGVIHWYALGNWSPPEKAIAQLRNSPHVVEQRKYQAESAPVSEEWKLAGERIRQKKEEAINYALQWVTDHPGLTWKQCDTQAPREIGRGALLIAWEALHD